MYKTGQSPNAWKKNLEELEIRGQIEIIQTTSLLRLARIQRRVLETWGKCCHSESSERPPAYADMENSQGAKKKKKKYKRIQQISTERV